jgi:hypothetical protein
MSRQGNITTPSSKYARCVQTTISTVFIQKYHRKIMTTKCINMGSLLVWLKEDGTAKN